MNNNTTTNERVNAVINAVAEHATKPSSTNPAVYVSTYAKYNNGSLAGAWLDLTTFDDYDEFDEFCRDVLHADESDPEIMISDSEFLPRFLRDDLELFYDVKDDFLRLMELCDEENAEEVANMLYKKYGDKFGDHISAYIDAVEMTDDVTVFEWVENGYGDPEDIQDYLACHVDDWHDYAEEQFFEIHPEAESFSGYIDLTAWRRDLEYDFCEIGNYMFWSH